MEPPRENVIEAARELFSRFGAAKTSVEEIARQAGLSKATVYNYFAGKEAIVAGVIEYERDILMGKLIRAVKSAEDPVAGIKAYFSTHSREVQRLTNYYRAAMKELPNYMPQVVQAMETARKAEQALLQKILTDGVRTGVFRPLGNVSLTARILYAAVVGLTSPLFGKPIGRSAAQRLDHLLEIVLMGLCSETSRVTGCRRADPAEESKKQRERSQ